MRVAIVIQARLDSQRLPKKILAEVDGLPMLAQLHKRMKASKRATAVIVACPVKDQAEIERATGLHCYGGPEQDLLTRLLGAAEMLEADMMVRVTGDCPLADPEMIDMGVGELWKAKNKGWCQDWEPRTYPDGLDYDIWRVDYLNYLDKKLKGDDREYFASWCLKNKEDNLAIINGQDLSRMLRLTVDYTEDLELVRNVYGQMDGAIWNANDIISYVLANPEVNAINAVHIGANNFGAKPE